MSRTYELPKFSLGVGDRFAQEAEAQLTAFVKAAKAGIDITPVWNKSNREHNIIGSSPDGTREAANSAVKQLGWDKPFFCDADHINLQTVDRFLEPCDFFTIDVADLIGQRADAAVVNAFVDRHPELQAPLTIEAIGTVQTSRQFTAGTAGKYLSAVQHAAEIYAKVESAKGPGQFVTEISMDETDAPQTPPELLVILAAIADFGIPIQTIAPKFTGRFNKGVDYVGDVRQFSKEFSDDIAVIRHAVESYGLPENLKLSVHSGSDKFSIYAPIHRILNETGAGLHVKTAGTTWLEEVIGLAEAGGDGLELAKQIYADAYDHREELCSPYSTVIDIKPKELPHPSEVRSWSSDQFTSALRHNQSSPAYNSSLRQLLHVGFKVAAKMDGTYLALLKANRDIVARNVTENLFDRHIRPIFLGEAKDQL
jgi:hypothetical protein